MPLPRSPVPFRARFHDSDRIAIEALRAITEHITPGRWDKVRSPNRQELAATMVLSIPLVEVSAKVRTGPPKDDEADYSLPVWAGVIPLKVVEGEPIPDS